MRTPPAFAGLGVALLASFVTALAQPKLTAQDGALVFPGADVLKSAGESAGRTYGEAWDAGYAPGEEKLLGLVFHKTLTLNRAAAGLLVGITPEGAISRVHLKEGPPVDGEFLAQFVGKNASADFTLARTLEEVLSVPTMLKAIRGQRELSETIAREVQELVRFARQMLAGSSQS